MKINGSSLAAALAIFILAGLAAGQKVVPQKAAIPSASRVTQIDAEKLKSLVKPSGRPLLINFWATWCDPCREEFPELVKISNDYKGKIDFITISLDDLADISTEVPKFLTEMKAEMPAYLLVTSDEEAAISSVSKDWSGGLPFTMLVDEKGGTAYFRQGKVRPDALRGELEKITSTTRAGTK